VSHRKQFLVNPNENTQVGTYIEVDLMSTIRQKDVKYAFAPKKKIVEYV